MGGKISDEIIRMFDRAGEECQKAMSEFLAGVQFALKQNGK